MKRNEDQSCGCREAFCPHLKPDFTYLDLQRIRPEVAAFAVRMEEVLQKNDWKGGWQEMHPLEVLIRLQEELRELAIVVGDASVATVFFHNGQPANPSKAREEFNQALAEKIQLEAIDVANFAMFIVDIMDKWGARSPTEPAPEPAPPVPGAEE